MEAKEKAEKKAKRKGKGKKKAKLVLAGEHAAGAPLGAAST